MDTDVLWLAVDPDGTARLRDHTGTQVAAWRTTPGEEADPDQLIDTAYDQADDADYITTDARPNPDGGWILTGWPPADQPEADQGTALFDPPAGTTTTGRIPR